MRHNIIILVVALAVAVRSASIVDKKIPDIGDTADQVTRRILTQNVDTLTVPTNVVKDIDNKLRNKVENDEIIPVTVITQEINSDEGDEIKINRLKLDVNNPGSPQRQEHNSQSPNEINEEQETVNNIKQTIKDSQNVFNQGLAGLSAGIQNGLTNNQQLLSIQDIIQRLQTRFQHHFETLNETLMNIWNTQQPQQSPVSQVTEISPISDTKPVNEQVSSANDVVSLKSDIPAESAPPATSPVVPAANNPIAGITNYIQQFQTSISQGFANLTTTIQNYINQNQGTGSQASPGFFQNIGLGIQNMIGQQNVVQPQNDESEGGESNKPQSPTIWQGIQNILSRPPNVINSQTFANGPIGQAIQNNPLYQGVVNLISPKPQAENKPSASSEGSNVVPPLSDEVAPQAEVNEEGQQLKAVSISNTLENKDNDNIEEEGPRNNEKQFLGPAPGLFPQPVPGQFPGPPLPVFPGSIGPVNNNDSGVVGLKNDDEKEKDSPIKTEQR